MNVFDRKKIDNQNLDLLILKYEIELDAMRYLLARQITGNFNKKITVPDSMDFYLGDNEVEMRPPVTPFKSKMAEINALRKKLGL